MEEIDGRIIKFIRRHHVLTIATAVNSEPWCANCFYAWFGTEKALVFTTDASTRHGQDFLKNGLVAGSIVLETMIIGKIRGLQFQGLVSEPEGALAALAKKTYLLKFPPAALMDTHLWIVKLTYLKYTDNRLGFGKKLIWSRDQALGHLTT